MKTLSLVAPVNIKTRLLDGGTLIKSEIIIMEICFVQ